MIEKFFQGMAIDKTAFTPEDIKIFKQAVAQPGALTAMLNYYRNIFQAKISNKNWRKLDIPTLMIWGESDNVLGKELTYGTQSYVNQLQINYIPNCSHWVQQEKPQLVNQYVREFLELPSPMM